MANKEFIGWVSVKDVEGRNGNADWQYTQVSFKIDDLEKMKNFVNDKGYINLKLNRSQKGKEYLEIDTFGLNKHKDSMPPIPDGPEQPQMAAPMPPAMPDFPDTDDSDDDVPF